MVSHQGIARLAARLEGLRQRSDKALPVAVVAMHEGETDAEALAYHGELPAHRLLVFVRRFSPRVG